MSYSNVPTRCYSCYSSLVPCTSCSRAILPFPYFAATQYPQPPQVQASQSQQIAQHNRNQGQRQQGQRKPERGIDSVHMPYGQLLPQLLNCSLVQLRKLGPPPTPLPQGYDANPRCEFH